ncbi:MAG: hypothetical protein E6Q97_26840 [Desulfurellales bacterium]|nr:MAG: hypothetical protein E6Q97_26840 [Desulfurellales bacterium]
MTGTARTRTEMESRFETGDQPSAVDFADLLASALLVLDDDATRIGVDGTSRALWDLYFSGLPETQDGRLSVQGLLNQLLTQLWDTIAAGYTLRGQWQTGVAYALPDAVLYLGTLYAVRTEHTSGTFAADLAAGRVEAVQMVTGPLTADTYLRRTLDGSRWDGVTPTELAAELAALAGGALLARAGGSLTGRVKFAASTEAVLALGAVSGAVVLDLSAASCFSFTATGNITISFVSPQAGAHNWLTLYVTNGGAYTITWPGAVNWHVATAPALQAAGLDVLGFMSADGGTLWRGVSLWRPT